MLSKASLALSLPALASATFLYAGAYSGLVTTLNLDIPSGSYGDDGPASLVAVSTADGCKGSPAWLELDAEDRVLYCSDEGLTKATGSISSFRTGGEDGALGLLNKLDTAQGPVSSIRYGKGGLAVAHYATSKVTFYDVSDPSALTPIDEFNFTLSEPGPVPDRQDAPHPHQAVVDPTGAFVVVSDLGSDLIRLFAIGDDGLSVSELEPFAVTPGAGPRHVAFLETKGGDTIMYVVTELANTVIGYSVKYADGSIEFEELFSVGTHGEGVEVPKGAAASEITLSPDNKFLIVASRLESSFTIPNPVPSEGAEAEVPSDSITTFSVGADGALEFHQTAPSGGRNPRHFSINRSGDLVAVALQDDGTVVVYSRDVKTGELGDVVAAAALDGLVTCVIFDE
ncbi:uncharacterized protein DNG_08600 [Cephalotrichum gorgonifer]|uniref:6-phosphogluconolactonase n=1 Tax=Cephalotrichum gorgonifer TaxID=2041049 RepID=A0AAE8SYI3_9PEZI|nr:uncharacterized protein DNG_08600 [Cephalotrichum gorgonifer]